MTIEPFLIEPLALEPGWMEGSTAHYRIYHGLGDSELIDYTTPVALAPLDSSTVSLTLPMAQGQKHFLAARAVSAAGVEEQNTHVTCCAEVDEAGTLLTPPLAAISNLTAHLQPGGLVVLGFTYRPPPGYAAAEQFKIFTDAGTGSLHLDDPLVTVEAETSLDHEVVITTATIPVMFAVRACAGGRSGPVSPPVTVHASPPEPPVVLP